MPAWTTNRNRSAVKEHRVSLGTQRTYAPTTLVVAAATSHSCCTSRLSRSLQRPAGSAEHACASSAQLFPGPAPSSAFLGRRRPRVPDRQAMSIACSRRRSRTYVLLAGRISFRWTVDRFSLVGASGRPAFLDHHTIARGRAELASFVCMQTQEQRGGETSRQAHPADKPSCFLLLRPPLHSSMMSNQRCMQGPQFLFLRLYMFTYQYWFFLVAIYNHAYA